MMGCYGDAGVHEKHEETTRQSYSNVPNPKHLQSHPKFRSPIKLGLILRGSGFTHLRIQRSTAAFIRSTYCTYIFGYRMIPQRYAWLVLVLVPSLWRTALVASFAGISTTIHHSSRPTILSRRSTTELHVKRLFSKIFLRAKAKPHPNTSSFPAAITTNEQVVHAALVGRRTVNNFCTTSVPWAVVQRAMEAAIHAPCHGMTEPWRFVHLGNETISNIAALNAADIAQRDPVKGAKKKARWEAIPGWCVVTSAKSDGGLQEREDYAATCCAVQNFMVSLWAAGVGTKWTSGPITRTDAFAALCGIDPAKELVVGCIWYGHANNGLEAVPTPTRKKSVSDVSSTRP